MTKLAQEAFGQMSVTNRRLQGSVLPTKLQRKRLKNVALDRKTLFHLQGPECGPACLGRN